MAFGGFFGGGGAKDNDDNSTSTSSTDHSTTITSPNLFASSNSGGGALQRIQSAITEQSNIANAKQLISNVNTNCFEKCVSAPGTSLSAGEQKCLTACMEKYIDAWNVTSRTYTARLQKESAQFQGLSPGAGGGKELF